MADNKILAWIKAHPWETGIITFVVGVILIYALSGSSGSATTSDSSTGESGADIQAAMQLQSAQIQAGVQNNAIQASAGTTNNQTAAQVSIATLQAQTQQNNDSLSATTAQFLANLEAGVSNNQTAAQVAINATNTAALQAIALAPYQVEEDQIAASHSGDLAQLQAEITNLGVYSNVYGQQLGALLSGSPVPAANYSGMVPVPA